MKEVFIHKIEKQDKLPNTGGIYLSGKNMVVSDGYHTFDELYEFRINLFMGLCKFLSNYNKFFADTNKLVSFIREPWRSKLHSDGTKMEGFFILGINKQPGLQMTLHVPLERWDEVEFVETLKKAPEWDGHSPADVLERIKKI